MAAESARKKLLLKDRIPEALRRLESCALCPRQCRVNRTQNQAGVCRTLDQAVVYGYMPHFGEEPPLSGINGSGTIFFSHCNLGCCFCQNHDISIQGEGNPATADQIAEAMVHLQQQGCHNINLVTPTHVMPFILQALHLALDMGLTLPLVWNSSGYETPEALKLLDGIVDIYMPDFKFWDPELARAACNAPDYPRIAKDALKIMHHQVGDLVTDEQGIARSGLLIRHLVMPETDDDIDHFLEFLASEISPRTHINLMSQYRPLFRAHTVPSFTRPPSTTEFRTAVAKARDLGLVLVR